MRVPLAFALVMGSSQLQAVDLHGCLVEPSHIAEVGSPVVGVIERVTFERGDAVRRGQALVFLKAEVEQAATGLASARAKAEAEVRSAQSNNEFAQRKLKRSAELQQQNFISQQALDQAHTEAELAEQKLTQARENKRVLYQELALARAQLAQRTIVSPIDGVILERYVTTGERVEQQTIAKIATLDPLRVEVIVPAAYFNKIGPGMSARIQPDLPETPALQARIILVDRVIDTASNSFRVRMDLPNPGNALPAGVRCKADLGLPAVAKSTDKAKTPQVTPSGIFAPPALGAAARTDSRVGVPPPAAKPVAATLQPATALTPKLSPPPQAQAANPASGAGSPVVRQPMSGLAPTKLRLSTKIALGNLAQP